MSRSSKGGVTLLEVIVSAAVMTLFTTMVAHAVVVAYRSHGRMADRITHYRRACAASGMLARELQACDRLYSPTVGQWRFDEPFSPRLSTDPLIFRRPSTRATSGYVAVCIWFIPPTETRPIGELRRQVREVADPKTFSRADFPSAPLAPGESEEGRILMRTVERFDITHLNMPSPRSCRVSASLAQVTTPIVGEVSVTQW